MMPKLSISKIATALLLATALGFNTGCATGETKKVIIGMIAGGAVGAFVGSEFVRSGENHQYRTQNTIISAAVGALLVGGFLAWHYDQVQEKTVEISAQYSRYRLCNPDEMPPEVVQKMGLGAGGDQAQAVQLKPEQVGKLALTLDDSTKWTFPIFRKRFLAPERGETQVVSDHYVWEIMRPGAFVTRTQDPQYFVEPPPPAPAPAKDKEKEP